MASSSWWELVTRQNLPGVRLKVPCSPAATTWRKTSTLLLWCFFSFQFGWYAEELPFNPELLLNRNQLIRANHSDCSALSQSSKKQKHVNRWCGKTQRRRRLCFQLFRRADKLQHVKVLRARVLWENHKQGFFVYAALYGVGLVNAVGWISCFPFMNEV